MKENVQRSTSNAQRPTTLCLCGCGTELQPDDRGRLRSWVKGHWALGKKHKPERLAKMSTSMKKAWSEPANVKLQALRTPSPEQIERRISKLRGRKLPLERVEQMRRDVRAAWAAGKYANAKKPTFYAPRIISQKQKDHIVKVGKPFATKEWLAMIRAKRDMAKLKELNRARMLGTHGMGRGAADRPDHFNALHWIIRDNRGVLHEFDNLYSWCRRNEHRFLPDARPKSKLPLWRRAVSGFMGMQRTDGKGQHAWNGWTLVSVKEREALGAPDLLGRAG